MASPGSPCLEVSDVPTVREEPTELETLTPTEPGRELPVEALVDALRSRFSMETEDAMAIADVVAEQFEGKEEVNDDTLSPEVRSIFYTLEAKKLLSFRRTEYTIDTGERRRAFFWRVRHDELSKIAALASAISEESVYDQLPKSAWAHRTAG
jgi:hypothetical protein